MSNGDYFNPWAWYAVLEYQYPLSETYPVVRVPVAGPEPFNTLVIVRGNLSLQPWSWADGKLHHYRFGEATPFRLIGHDPRVEAPYEHSTTAVIQGIQTSDDTSFATGVDGIGGSFDSEGRWIVTGEVTAGWDNVLAGTHAYVSSWVLCYEPPPPPPPKKRTDGRFRRFSPELGRARVEVLRGSGDRRIGGRGDGNERHRPVPDLFPSAGPGVNPPPSVSAPPASTSSAERS
jgi:hypothetical protein